MPAPRAHPVLTQVASREQRHRRVTLLAIAGLLLASTSPVFGHHLPIDTDAMLAGIDHIGALCVTALHLLLEPVHAGLKVVIGAGLVYAIVDRVRAWHRVRRVLDPLEARRPTPGDAFWSAAADAGLDPRSLRVVAELPNPAFTVGLLAPRVYVAASLTSVLSRDELVAVLAHEGAHVARRDPLRQSLLRAVACTLFWIPALGRLAEDVADEAEVLADDVAAAGRPLVLASAILTLTQWRASAAALPSTVGFEQPDLLERRVRRLAGEAMPPRSHVTRRSLAGAAAALGLVWVTGLAVAHPLPVHAASMHERHCDHRSEWVMSHLFCLGASHAPGGDECPHRSAG